MNVFFENVNFNSNSGPNSFGRKLAKQFQKNGQNLCSYEKADVVLSFIQSHRRHHKPNILRLDGIYFNLAQNWEAMNKEIHESYKRADGIIAQSNFSKKLIEAYFGEHPNIEVIHNGAELELINSVKPLNNRLVQKYDNIWSCAAAWRPHKRLNENVKYFLEHKGQNDCLIVAGSNHNVSINHPDIYCIGNVDYETLLRIYKTSKWFLHLGWLDNCPNVVVDAKAAGCKIVCSSSGGTPELVRKGDIIIQEEEWDFKPTMLYEPPELDFSRKVTSEDIRECYSIQNVANKYELFLEENLNVRKA